MLLDRTPKDYDVSTAATPEEVREVFGRRQARIIGKRFRLVHVHIGGGDIVELANRSVYQTLTRSIYTVCTVLFTTFALYWFGGETTKDFSFALLVGFFSGCYSSIFIASPLWVTLRNLAEEKKRRLA